MFRWGRVHCRGRLALWASWWSYRELHIYTFWTNTQSMWTGGREVSKYSGQTKQSVLFLPLSISNLRTYIYVLTYVYILCPSLGLKTKTPPYCTIGIAVPYSKHFIKLCCIFFYTVFVFYFILPIWCFLKNNILPHQHYGSLLKQQP